MFRANRCEFHESDGEATLQRGRAPPVQREPYAQETQEDWEHQVLSVTVSAFSNALTETRNSLYFQVISTRKGKQR